MPLHNHQLKELERAMEATARRSEKVRSSVADMKREHAEGEAQSRKLIKILLAIGAAIFLIASAVLLSEPRSRGAYVFLVFCLAGAAAWSYYRSLRGD